MGLEQGGIRLDAAHRQRAVLGAQRRRRDVGGEERRRAEAAVVVEGGQRGGEGGGQQQALLHEGETLAVPVAVVAVDPGVVVLPVLVVLGVAGVVFTLGGGYLGGVTGATIAEYSYERLK